MDTLLKHLLNVTGHRDHQMLEISILLAIQQIADAVDARMLRILFSHGQMMVVPHAWIIDGKVGIMNDTYESERNEAPLSSFPVLEECVNNASRYLKETMPDNTCKLWFPIMEDGKVTICFEIHRKLPFSRRLLDRIEGLLGVYGNFSGLLDYSERDSLTGLLNRKTFEKHFKKRRFTNTPQSDLAREQQDRRRDPGNERRWLAVVDIDHFKSVNDVFGHSYGDEVLILIAHLMKSSFRSIDRIFRFGGEEFAILIYSSTLESVSAIVERFRSAVENHRFSQVGKITVSIGFTGFLPDQSPVVVLGHADQALYYAKEHGRNMVCHYDDLVERGLLVSDDQLEVASVEFF